MKGQNHPVDLLVAPVGCMDVHSTSWTVSTTETTKCQSLALAQGAVMLSSALRPLSAGADARFVDARKGHSSAELGIRRAVMWFSLVSRDRQPTCPDVVLAFLH